MKFDAPKNSNYAAVVVSVPSPVDLPGLDKLVGIPILGHQALTTRGIQAGDLRVAFTAETALSLDFCAVNNLYRDATLNKDPEETGYLDKNRRIRAIKLRGYVSNALLMPLDSLAFTGIGPEDLREGDTFDVLNGHEVCCKYEIPVKQQHGPKASKLEQCFKRVDEKLFPEHLSTDSYFRNKHLLHPGREVVASQKLHGTSWRGGRVPVRRQLKWYERLLKKLGVQIPEYEFAVIFGSRKAIKDPANERQQHFYASDIWTSYGGKIADLLPEGTIVFGELVGWTPGPDAVPIQKGYTYQLQRGEAELYVYRVSQINAQGFLTDLPWDGVKEFCQARGLKWVPELTRLLVLEHGEDSDPTAWIDDLWERIADSCYSDGMANSWDEWGGWTENPLPLSDKKTVDEGICLRQEGLVPTILKLKSAKFLEHETRLIDTGEVDLESAA